jgi:hypothetical protein
MIECQTDLSNASSNDETLCNYPRRHYLFYIHIQARIIKIADAKNQNRKTQSMPSNHSSLINNWHGGWIIFGRMIQYLLQEYEMDCIDYFL